MSWIVLGENKGRINLVSKSVTTGILPKGSYLTVEKESSKFILRVDQSSQIEPFSPSPLIIDMELTALKHDQKCKNIISAYRVKDISNRMDGLIDFIPPQSIARRSTQEEIDIALGNLNKGPEVFVATVHSSQNQLLTDDENNYIKAILPIEMFYHQMLVCGKTGSGKTVATKYLAQYFVEKLEGAVLAINVKDVDFLQMDQASTTENDQVQREWDNLKSTAHGIENFMVYYPANTELNPSKGVNPDIANKITLKVMDIDPDSLIGLFRGISDIGAQNLPNVFRYWKDVFINEVKECNCTFNGFCKYFDEIQDNGRRVNTLNSRGDIGEIQLHKGTYDNILRNLDYARDFFDNEDAISLNERNILVNGKMSVIDVTGDKGIQFGSILLRDLLKRIVSAKSDQRSSVPILIIIDEVHTFYNTEASIEALGDLDIICRTGRSQEIGVIFSSQNPSDIPRGLTSVLNSKIFFKSDVSAAKSHGIAVSVEEMESLNKGYAVASIYNLSQLKLLKFPLAFSGVFN